MAETEFDDRDEAVLEAVGGDPQTLNGDETDSDAEYVTRDEYDELAEQFHEFKQGIVQQVNRLEEEVNRLKDGSVKTNYPTTIHKFAAMVEDGREDHFTNQESLRRAVAIHRHWEEWVQSLKSTDGISTRKKSTRKYQPAQITVDLNESDAPGDDLQANQVQKAMQTLAKKSYRESEDEIEDIRNPGPKVKRRISGGLYRYEHRTTPSNEDSSTYHVVVKDE